MATEKQIQANRRNALRSTGPKTPEGKAAVRLNALQHGLRARSILLPGENSDDLQQLFKNLESDWQPKNRTEQLLVEQMAVAQWKLARLEVGERSIFMQDMGAERQLALLDRFSVQRGRLERSFSRALRELQSLRQMRHTEEIPEHIPLPANEPEPRFSYTMAGPDPGAWAGEQPLDMAAPGDPGEDRGHFQVPSSRRTDTNCPRW